MAMNTVFVSMEMLGSHQHSGHVLMQPGNALQLPLHLAGNYENHMAAGQPVVAMLDPPGLLPAHTAAMMPAQTTAMPEQTTAMSSVYPVMVQYNGQVMQPNLQLVQPNLQMMQPHTQTVVQSPSTIFFAGCSPIVARESLLNLFAQFGRVMDLNLFRPYKGCRTSKGCGLVVFSQASEAAAALETLHGRFVWPGARSPMIIEWCDPNKQHKRKRAQPLTPSAMQHMLTFQQQQAVPSMHMMMPAGQIGVTHMLNGYACAGRMVMTGY